MNWQSVLAGDKTPLVVALALTIFGWYIDSISKYFSETSVVYVTDKRANEQDEYVLKNVSLGRNVERLAVQIQCIAALNCLRGSGTQAAAAYGAIEQIAPFAAASTQSCFQDSGSYQVQVTLPPGASVRLRVAKNAGAKTELFVAGTYADRCDSPSLSNPIRIETYPSGIAFLLQNFVLYYFVSIIILIVLFVATIWKMLGPASAGRGSNESKTSEPKALSVDLTFRRAPREPESGG